jgi:hypothetical protein
VIWDFSPTGPDRLAGSRVIFSLVYMIVRQILALLLLLLRRDVSKEAELLPLRHENAVLRRNTARIHYEPRDRLWLAALSRVLPRSRWHRSSWLRPRPYCAGTGVW